MRYFDIVVKSKNRTNERCQGMRGEKYVYGENYFVG